jgi:dienelactone hydrolase
MTLVANDLFIPIDGARLRATLTLPDRSEAVILFAHGSGSSRLSPRNARVALALAKRGLGTLLFDLLTSEEAREDNALRGYRFDIELLAERLATATSWLKRQRLAPKRLAYFGTSTGAAAALVAAARAPTDIAAVVTRSGRPDLAGPALSGVEAPTLLVVGADDGGVVELNERALQRLRCVKELAVVPGATNLFEEPGKLDEAARLAADWFVRHCTGHPDQTPSREATRASARANEP